MKIYVAYDTVRNEIIGEYGSAEERADAVLQHFSYLEDPFEIGLAVIDETYYFETTEEEIGEL